LNANDTLDRGTHPERLLREIAPDGPDAANRLRRLLDLKDNAQYGFLHVGGQDLQAVLRQSRALIEFAERSLRG
jgi:hypothetical protein